jgi:eukaryotic-like serine/threonine-protein kinase
LALVPGSRIGPYDITAQVGAGGMGEVYRATDTNLKREVAIKVLPASLAADPERLSRFQREAEVLAALNHPNIATIHGLEKSAEHTALVMELVDGEDLSQRIARGAIPVDEALPIAKQIAEALEAAHEQGIIHRDLKPANIKVRDDGTVKVLDFGLAKALDQGTRIADQGSGEAANSPTITSPAMTMRGVILGTAAYMSPEQARGKAVSKRADIWAFGAVLYEMLTGRRAFNGEETSDVLAAVLRQDVDWALLPPATPAVVRQLLERCLARDTKQRLADASTVRLDLELAMGTPKGSARTIKTNDTASSPTPWIATAVVMALIAIVLATVHFRENAPVSAPEMRLDIGTPGLTAADGTTFFALAPDGQSIAYGTSGDPGWIWIRRFDQPAAQQLAGTENGRGPFWSPDSKSIAFWADGKLKRLDLSGGTPLTLCDADIGGTWNADGVILFRTPAGLWRINASGGQPSRLPVPGTILRFPEFLPDGRHFLFVSGATGGAQTVLLGTLDGGEPKPLVAGSLGRWLPPDRLLYLDQGRLLSRRLDVTRGELTDDTQVIAGDARSSLGIADWFATSLSGTIAYRLNEQIVVESTWVDRGGRQVGALTDLPGVVSAEEISPDGQRIAVDLNTGNRDIWLVDPAQRGPTRFTFDSEADGFPVWSPDGQSIAFESNRAGNYDIYVKPANGSTPEQPLLMAPGQQWPVDFSKNGRFLLYYDQVNSGDLMALPLSGSDRRPITVAATPAVENLGAISPDSGWVAYQTTESGRSEVVVQAFPRVGGKWQVSTGGGTQPRWSADGKELYFVSGGTLMASAVTATGNSFASATPVKLFSFSSPGTPLRHRYAVSRDGRFLLFRVKESSATTTITLVLNWRPKLLE